MTTILRLRKILLLVLVVLAGLAAAPRPASADLIENFASVLDQVPGVFPISGDDIRYSRDFFKDLQTVSNDKQVAELLEKYKDTPIGQQASSAVGGTPSWFWDFIGTYIAFREGDFWGVVGHLGKGAICVVAQFLAGGVDACGLIEALIEAAETFADAAKAIAQFVASVGGAVWEGIKSVGCGLGFGGCSGGGSPPEQIAYAWVFQPTIPLGVTAREALSTQTFDGFVAQLEKDAQVKPCAKLHYPGLNVCVGLGESATKIASAVYREAVEVGWRKDVIENALPSLLKKRYEFDNPQQVAVTAKMAALAYSNNPNLPSNAPTSYVPRLCTDHFAKGLGFAHVDRWIAKYPGDAKTAGDAKTNEQWCLAAFWKKKDEFGKHFRDYAKANFCPEFGSTLLCTTVSQHAKCVGLLGGVGLAGQCGIDVGAAGKDAAEKIHASLKAKGSKIPCTVVADGQIFSNKPADLICTRPTQQHECVEMSKPYSPPAVPAKLVNCALNETAQYKALRGKVAGAAASLNQQYPNPPNGIPFIVDPIDPLIVHAPAVAVVAEVKEKNPGFGFGPPSAKPGFEYYTFQFPRPVDGLNTPGLGMDVKLPKNTQGVQLDKMQEKVALVKPGDPDPFGKAPTGAGKLSSGLGAAAAAPSGALAGAAQVQGPGATKTGAASLGAGASAQMKAAPGAISAPKGPDLGGVPAPAPTSGPAPAPGGRLASQGGARTAAVSADIKSGPRVLVAGKYPVVWGQGITVSDADARRAANGVCEIAVSHDTLNVGKAATGPFGRRWANQQNPASLTDTYPSIPASGSLQRTDTLALKPGMNRLTLALDPMNQVKETNDNDNIYQLTITVNGTCGLPSTAPSPAPGTVPGPRTAPAPRLPAVQRK